MTYDSIVARITRLEELLYSIKEIEDIGRIILIKKSELAILFKEVVYLQDVNLKKELLIKLNNIKRSIDEHIECIKEKEKKSLSRNDKYFFIKRHSITGREKKESVYFYSLWDALIMLGFINNKNNEKSFYVDCYNNIIISIRKTMSISVALGYIEAICSYVFWGKKVSISSITINGEGSVLIKCDILNYKIQTVLTKQSSEMKIYYEGR